MNNGISARLGVKIGIVAALAGVLVLGSPLAANAHVKVTPDQAAAGDDIALTFRVPNESATAGTIKVEIDLPIATPFAGAEYDPVPGWTARVVTAKLDTPIKNDGVEITEAPTKVIFTADRGVRIADGQFQEFALALDLAPDTGKVEFPVTQTYSDGTVVKWNESTPASGEEPDSPAPTLYINTAAPTTDHHAGGVEAGSAPEGSTSAGSTSAGSTEDSVATSALILGSAGLGIGVIALVLAIFAFARTRRAN